MIVVFDCESILRVEVVCWLNGEIVDLEIVRGLSVKEVCRWW